MHDYSATPSAQEAPRSQKGFACAPRQAGVRTTCQDLAWLDTPWRMQQLIYISHAVASVGEPELREILNASRKNNLACGVCGMLLYHDRSFIQVLEGATLDVKRTFARIQDDPRHHRVHILLSRDVETHEFSDWSMGFVSINRSMLSQLSGFRDVFVQGFSEPSAASVAHSLLRSFREERWRKVVDS